MTETTNWYGPDTATFGDRLSGARDAMGMTQEDLANRLGIKLRTLEAWEDDLSEPRANRLSMLSGLLNVSIGWLITGEGTGVEAPEDIPVSTDLRDILIDMRRLKAEIQTSAESLARLEKRLRKIVAAGDAS